MHDYGELRETYLPAEEIAAIVAAGCPEIERGKDPAYYVMALVTQYVTTEIKPLFAEHLDAPHIAELIDVVVDLVATMMCHQHTASSKLPVDEFKPIDELLDHATSKRKVPSTLPRRWYGPGLVAEFADGARCSCGSTLRPCDVVIDIGAGKTAVSIICRHCDTGFLMVEIEKSPR